jgi:hypothetical protein
VSEGSQVTHFELLLPKSFASRDNLLLLARSAR